MGGGLSIINQSAIDILVILSQVTPCHWNTQPIKPGEMHSFDAGQVWFTVEVDRFRQKKVPSQEGVALSVAAIGATAVAAPFLAAEAGAALGIGLTMDALGFATIGAGAACAGATAIRAGMAPKAYQVVSSRKRGVYADKKVLVVKGKVVNGKYLLSVHRVRLKEGGARNGAISTEGAEGEGAGGQLLNGNRANNAEGSDVDEPESLLCPIAMELYRDPVFVPTSGNTYERSSLERFWATSTSARDPLTNQALPDKAVHSNWDKRREVQKFLDAYADYVPHGWDSRDVPRAQPSTIGHTRRTNNDSPGMFTRGFWGSGARAGRRGPREEDDAQ
jgi:hypothetical protein